MKEPIVCKNEHGKKNRLAPGPNNSANDPTAFTGFVVTKEIFLKTFLINNKTIL